MADLVSRLKLESGEFDSKIKRAGQELLAYAEHCKKTGLQMGFANKDAKDFAKALGDMQTVSQTARGKLNELTEAFTNLKAMYNQMTDAEKQNTFGKELAASLEKLKGRINEAKQNLNSVNAELGNTKQAEDSAKGGIEGLTSALGVNLQSLAGWGAALTVAKGALEVAKDAFFATEGNIDAWGRTVKEAEGAYDVFLQTINNGNWSNFFQNLNSAMKGARELYDALDRLGSVKSNNQAAIAIQQQRIQQLRLMKDQGKNVDEELKAATERLAQLQNQAVQAGKTAGAKSVKETIRNRYNTQEGGQIGDKTLDRVTQELVENGQVAFDKYRMRADALKKKAQDTRIVTQTGSGGVSYSYKETFTNLNKLTEEERKQFKLATAITEGETAIAEGIGIYAQAVQEGAASAREQFKGNKYAKATTGGGKGGSGSNPQEQAAKAVKDAELAYSQAVGKARLALESGRIDDTEVKKRTLQAQEQLWTAYGKAYATYADPKYKEAQDAAAAEIVKLGGEVKTATEAQKAAEQAAREQEAAAKKLAAEEQKLADAYAEAATAAGNNDLKGFLAANKKAEGMGGTAVEMPLTFTATSSNIDAFLGHLKEQLSTADVGSELANKLTAQMADATAMKNVIELAMKSGIDMAVVDPSGLWKKVFTNNPGDYIDDKSWENLQQTINEKLAEMGIEPIKIELQTGNLVQAGKDVKSVAGNFRDASSAISAVGTALNSIEDPGVKVAGIVAQAIGTVASAFAGALASDGTTKSNIWAFIAAAAASTASMITMINSIHSATGYANGGIVGGNSYSGDNLRTSDYGINAGELVLNRAQQGNLASQLEGGVEQPTNLQPYVNGENVFLGINNSLGSRGQGELVTTSMMERWGLI